MNCLYFFPLEIQKIKVVFLPFFQNLLLRSPDRMLTLLFSTTLWWSGKTVSPLTLLEASISLIPWKARLCQWGKTGTEERESPAGYMASTLLHGAIFPRLNLQHNALTARGFAPGSKMLLCTLDTHRGEKGNFFPAFSPPVGSCPLRPKDMSTITTMSTIIITTITTTLHKCISNTYETGEKSWCTLLNWYNTWVVLEVKCNTVGLWITSFTLYPVCGGMRPSRRCLMQTNLKRLPTLDSGRSLQCLPPLHINNLSFLFEYPKIM